MLMLIFLFFLIPLLYWIIFDPEKAQRVIEQGMKIGVAAAGLAWLWVIFTQG